MSKPVLRLGLTFAGGVLFAVGLALSGMTNPSKVAAFLDVSGQWDPSLAFVMIGAIGVYLPLQLLARGRVRPLLAPRFDIPEKKIIDARLVGGAAIFGLGWGALGYCPAPAIASLGVGGIKSLLFVAGMLGGMGLLKLLRARTPVQRTERTDDREMATEPS